MGLILLFFCVFPFFGTFLGDFLSPHRVFCNRWARRLFETRPGGLVLPGGGGGKPAGKRPQNPLPQPRYGIFWVVFPLFFVVLFEPWGGAPPPRAACGGSASSGLKKCGEEGGEKKTNKP